MKCEGCKHREDLDGIVGCLYMGADCENGEMYEPLTNADRVRAMSDEELAMQFVEVVKEAIKAIADADLHNRICEQLWSQFLEKLRQPVKDGEGNG